MSTATHDYFSLFGSSDGKNAVLANNWWVLALRGVLLIIMGILAFTSIVFLITLIGAYMLIDRLQGMFELLQPAIGEPLPALKGVYEIRQQTCQLKHVFAAGSTSGS